MSWKPGPSRPAVTSSSSTGAEESAASELQLAQQLAGAVHGLAHGQVRVERPRPVASTTAASGQRSRRERAQRAARAAGSVAEPREATRVSHQRSRRPAAPPGRLGGEQRAQGSRSARRACLPPPEAPGAGARGGQQHADELLLGTGAGEAEERSPGARRAGLASRRAERPARPAGWGLREPALGVLGQHALEQLLEGRGQARGAARAGAWAR